MKEWDCKDPDHEKYEGGKKFSKTDTLYTCDKYGICKKYFKCEKCHDRFKQNEHNSYKASEGPMLIKIPH
jgi:uncharacterized CHY-type Zn-finger protein